MRDGGELTAAQLGIWLGHQRSSQPEVYNCAEEVTIEGSLSTERFEEALYRTLRAASSLHVAFVEVAGRPTWRRVDFDPRFRFVDVSSEPHPEGTMNEQVVELLGRPLHIEAGQLYEQRLFRVSSTRHVWVLVAHHIALDGYGFQLLESAVASCYTTGKEPRFDSLDAVAVEDRRYHQSRQRRDDAEYWKRGAGCTARGVDLSRRVDAWAHRPSDVQVPLRWSAAFPDRLRDELVLSAKRMGRSWPELLLALVAGYVHQQLGYRRFALGVPMMLRLGTAALRVPCMAMNIVRLPITVQPGDSVASLLRQTSQRLVGQAAHQRYRYEELGQAPFGPVVNILPVRPPLRFGATRAVVRTLAAGPAADLSLSFASHPDRLEFVVEGHPALYDAASLEQLHAEFTSFAHVALAHSDAALATRTPSLPDVLERIAGRAQRDPTAMALIECDEQGALELTYGDMLGAVRRIASQLQALGAQAGDLVALDLPRGATATCVILGALAAGCGYLALDPAHPIERRRQILEQALPGVVVATRPSDYAVADTAGAAADSEGRRPLRVGLSVEAVQGMITAIDHDSSGDERTWTQVDQRDPAYVVFTSGSTGQPKGVVVSRGALSHYVDAALECYSVTVQDRALQFASLAFDASVEELFVSLCAGATLVVRSDAMLESMSGFCQALERHRISLLNLPTAFWHELTWSLWKGHALFPACVKTVVIGGEAADPTRVEQWLTVVRGTRLMNTYGPSEATVVATAVDLSRERGPMQAVPIGRPLRGIGVQVVDEEGRVVDTEGVSGELLISGPTLADGYLGQPDWTAERFVRDRDGVRAYKTGDLVRLTDDGQLVFVGRVDSEIKLSGYRIVPAEIERCLSRHPAVRACAVTAERRGTLASLKAHVEVQSDVALVELRAFVTERLPLPMVPTAWCLVGHLPRTTSGKIDRRALVEQCAAESKALASAASTEGAAASTEGAAASTEEAAASTEEAAASPCPLLASIAAVFSDVLGAASVQADDDFFALGGNSLQVITAANRLSQFTSVATVAGIFQNPTPRLLALHVRRAAGAMERVRDAHTSVADGPAKPAPHIELHRSASGRRDYRDVEPLQLECRRPPPRGGLRTVVLTGATGFVGVHVLARLLCEPGAVVYCAVRAGDADVARRRLDAALSAHGLALDDAAQRVITVPWDLANEPGEELTASSVACDAVVHCAAQVSLTRDFHSLYGANVASTRHLLSMAARAGAAFHYISSLAVLPHHGADTTLGERIYPDHELLRDGYQQSKWHSEQLCAEAARAGMPVCVHRLGRITGSREHPAVNDQDILWRIARASIAAEAWPRIDVREIWMPVDVAAELITQLVEHGDCRRSSESPSVFHYALSEPVAVSRLRDQLIELGYHLPLHDVSDWMDRVRGAADERDRATLAIFELMRGAPGTHIGSVSCEQLRRRLPQADTGGVDDDLLEAYCLAAIRGGHLPAPGDRNVSRNRR